MAERPTVDGRKFTPGFQGSETAAASAAIYTHGDDPVLEKGNQLTLILDRLGQKVSPRPEVEGGKASLIGVTTNKMLGAASGTFELQIKVQTEFLDFPDYDDLIVDDDWVDIVFNRFGDEWHVMRGLVDNVARASVVQGDGATTSTLIVSGRDFGKVFANTSVFFNQFIGENVGGGATLKAGAAVSLFGDPAKTTEAFLRAFLQALADSHGSQTWRLPLGMTNTGEAVFFNDSWTFLKSDFANDPARIAFNPNYLKNEGANLWDLAQNWSDPQFCEMWTDLIHKDGRLPYADEPLPLKDTRMAVIFRDRPFPILTGSTVNKTEVDNESLWFSPLFETATISRQEISAQNTGRGGQERYNAFFVRPVVNAQNTNSGIDLATPLWDKESIRRHGLRRMDVQTNYVSPQADHLGVSSVLRRRMRDFHALNAYYQNGTIVLGHSRPDIRVGMKLVIPGTESDKDTETYYVEGVSHNWTAPGQSRTTLTVTRGWVGTDREHLAALQAAADRYKTALNRKPGQALEGAIV